MRMRDDTKAHSGASDDRVKELFFGNRRVFLIENIIGVAIAHTVISPTQRVPKQGQSMQIHETTTGIAIETTDVDSIPFHPGH